MRRASTVTTAAAAVATNWASEASVPWFAQNGWIIWPILGVLVVLQIPERRAQLEPEEVEDFRPPERNLSFYGRRHELSRLKLLLNWPWRRFAVICGPSGIGKTALATELAARTKMTVWWIPWRGAESLVQLAKVLGLNWGHPSLVWKDLVEYTRWLIVIDNVDDPRQVNLLDMPIRHYRKWVRRTQGGLILITSTNSERSTWGRSAKLFKLGPLSTRESTAVLVDAAKKAGLDLGGRRQAEALATQLGGIPIALQAAWEGYRAVDEEPLDTITILRRTWERALDQLADDGDPLARPLLRVLSIAADAPLPRDLITPELLDRDVTQAVMDAALAGLYRYGLVDILSGPISCVTLHSLVREVNTRFLADEEELHYWQRTLDRALLAYADRVLATDEAGRDRARLLASHLAQVPRRLIDHTDAVLLALTTMNRVADLLHDVGDPVGEHRLLSAIVERTRAIHGPSHIETLGRSNDLAVALHALGEHESAFEVLERTLAGYEQTLGKDAPDTLGCRNNLAVATHSLGRRREAISLFEQALSGYERVLDEDALDTMACRVNLAEALRDTHDLERVVSLLEQTLDGYERVLRQDHPDTWRIRDKLATVLVSLGELERALALNKQTLADRKRVLGSDHPATRRSRSRVTAVRTMSEEDEQWRQRWRVVVRKRRQ